MATFTQGTNVDKIEIQSTGVVRVRFRKEVLKDGAVLSYEYHSVTLAPGDDTDTAFSVLNVNLLASDAAAITAASWAAVVAQCTAAWTDDVVAAYKTSIAISDATSTSSTVTASA